MKLIVDGLEFVDFNKAALYVNWKYGFFGVAWDQVIKDKSLKELNDYLTANNVVSELELIHV